MGLNLLLVIVGLAAAALGLGLRHWGWALVATAGWIMFLAGVAGLMVPGFFG